METETLNNERGWIFHEWLQTRDGNDKSKQLESVDLSLVAAPLVKDPSLSRCLDLSFPSLVFTSREIIRHSKCRFSRVPRVIHGGLAQSAVDFSNAFLSGNDHRQRFNSSN